MNLYTYCGNNPIFTQTLNILSNSIYIESIISRVLIQMSSLPLKGKPNSWVEGWVGHKKKFYQRRRLGPDGDPLYDDEYTNHGNPNCPNPHRNYWEKDKNGKWRHNEDKHDPVPEEDLVPVPLPPSEYNITRGSLTNPIEFSIGYGIIYSLSNFGNPLGKDDLYYCFD